MKNSISRMWLTCLFAVINAVVFVSLWARAGFTAPSSALLLDWGGNLAPFTLTGESWRLLTSAFLHVGWMHLLLNLYMLIVLGTLIERAIGSLRYGVVYLLSALGGSLASSSWYGFHETQTMQFAMGMFIPTTAIHPVVSVGASGALMGLAGAAAALHFHASLRNEGTAPVQIKPVAILQVIVLNLLSGFQISGIDQAAHIGGLCTGFLIGLMLQWLACGPKLVRLGAPPVIGVVFAALIFYFAQHAGTQDLFEWKRAMMEQNATQTE
jgi:membrane associated rhomboid family serine protease